MPNGHFNTVIRYIKQERIDRVQTLRTITYTNLRRIGCKRDLTKAVKGIPKGSDHLNVLSIKEWMEKISGKTEETEKAVNQVIAMDATAVVRTNG